MEFHSKFECEKPMRMVLEELKKDNFVAPYITDMETIFANAEDVIQNGKITNDIKRITGKSVYSALIRSKHDLSKNIPLLVQTKLFPVFYCARKYMPIMKHHGFTVEKVFDTSNLKGWGPVN